MKLVVLIPAYNEESNIEKTVPSIPRKISGIDKVQVLVTDHHYVSEFIRSKD